MGAASKALESARLPSQVSTGLNAVSGFAKTGRMMPPQQEQRPQYIPPSVKPVTTKPAANVLKVKPIVTKELKYKAPKNVFSNRSSFGKAVKIKPGNFS
jgi:hypothetical protein